MWWYIIVSHIYYSSASHLPKHQALQLSFHHCNLQLLSAPRLFNNQGMPLQYINIVSFYKLITIFKEWKNDFTSWPIHFHITWDYTLQTANLSGLRKSAVLEQVWKYKYFSLLKDPSAKLRPKFCSYSPKWWRLFISEKISKLMRNNTQSINQSNK